MSLWSLLPSTARICAILAAVVAVLSGLGVIAYKLEAHGFERCEARYKADAHTAWEKAAEKIKKEKSEYEKRIQALQEEKDSEGPVGPLTTRAVDSLRK